jgi:hypothetical protein
MGQGRHVFRNHIVVADVPLVPGHHVQLNFVRVPPAVGPNPESIDSSDDDDDSSTDDDDVSSHDGIDGDDGVVADDADHVQDGANVNAQADPAI